MKKLLSIFLLAFMFLFWSCQAVKYNDESDEIDSNIINEGGNTVSNEFVNTILKEDYLSKTNTVWNYNSDKSAVILFNSAAVDSICKMTIPTNLDDIENYCRNIVATVFDSVLIAPSTYYPRGKAGIFALQSDSGKIDLSFYKLPGDMNGDYEIDEKDITILASYAKNGLSFDINGDGMSDIKDAIYIAARYTTEAKYFSIFTKDGKTLIKDGIDITTKEFDVKDNDVVVVAVADGNKDSYMPKALGKRTNISTLVPNWNLMYLISEVLERPLSMFPSKYLVHWATTISMVNETKEYGTNTKIINGGLKEWEKSFREDFIANVAINHNLKVTERAPKFFINDNYLIAHAGIYSNDKSTISEIEATRFSHCKIKKSGSETKYKKLIFTYSHIMESSQGFSLYGAILIEGWEDVNGKMKFKRTGPGQQGFPLDSYNHSYDKDLEILSKNLNVGPNPIDVPNGEYIPPIFFKDDGFSITPDTTQIIYGKKEKKNFTYYFKGKSNVVGHIVNYGTNKPIEGTVKLDMLYKEANINIPQTSLINGEFSFKNVPIGKYKILLNGKHYNTYVEKDFEGNNSITIDTLYILPSYDIELKYISVKKDTATIKWDNVILNFTKPQKIDNNHFALTNYKNPISYNEYSVSIDSKTPLKLEDSTKSAKLKVYFKTGMATKTTLSDLYNNSLADDNNTEVYFQWEIEHNLYWNDPNAFNKDDSTAGAIVRYKTIASNQPGLAEGEFLSAIVPIEKLDKLLYIGQTIVIEETKDDGIEYTFTIKKRK